jgi:E3 ubiquitin-protein ligase SHPRH
MQTLRKITQDANPHDVDNAGRCGTCVTGGGERNNFFGNGANSHATRKSNVTCAHCAVSADMTAYEDSIFGRQASDDHVRGGARGRVARADVGAGRSAPSSVEYALRYLLTKFGPGVGKPQSTAVAEATVQSLENMRREFQRGNVLQKHQRDALHAADELCMATTRIRTRGSHEIALGGLPDPIPEHLRASVVHDWELPEMETQYASDRIVCTCCISYFPNPTATAEARLRPDCLLIHSRSEGLTLFFHKRRQKRTAKSDVAGAVSATPETGRRRVDGRRFK